MLEEQRRINSETMDASERTALDYYDQLVTAEAALARETVRANIADKVAAHEAGRVRELEAALEDARETGFEDGRKSGIGGERARCLAIVAATRDKTLVAGREMTCDTIRCEILRAP